MVYPQTVSYQRTLKLRVLKTPKFAYSAIIVTVINSALSAGSIVLPLYLQNVLGLSAFQTGMLMMPGVAASIIVSPLSGMLFDKFGPRVISIVGLLGLTGALTGLAFIGPATPIPYLVCIYVLQSAGLTLANMPVNTWGLNALKNEYIAHGNAISNTGRQVGGSISTAIIVTIMTMVTTAHQSAGPVLSAASGIRAAYGVSAGVAAVALVVAILKVRPDKSKIGLETETEAV